MSKAIELAEEAERLSAENIPRAWIFGPEARALVREMAAELRNMQGALEDLAGPHSIPGESPLETLRRVLRKPSEEDLAREAHDCYSAMMDEDDESVGTTRWDTFEAAYLAGALRKGAP